MKLSFKGYKNRKIVTKSVGSTKLKYSHKSKRRENLDVKLTP